MVVADLLLPVLLGLLVGLACGRSPRTLVGLRLEQLWLLWVAAGVQVAEYYVHPLRRFALAGGRPYFTAVIFGCVAGCLWFNARAHAGAVRAAWGLVGVGMVLNAIPLMANGTMPFNRHAALVAGVSPSTLNVVHVKNGMAHAGTAFAWLGDTIPVPGLVKVFSVGDCLICLGSALLIFSAMQRRTAVANRPTSSQQPVFSGAKPMSPTAARTTTSIS
jgi:hypothetical protein